jgi:hypothetical protein
MLRRVGVLAGEIVVDATNMIPVTVLSGALAKHSKVIIQCRQADGSMKDFNVLTGELPFCIPGAGNIAFPAGNITLQNIGTSPGSLVIAVFDDNPAGYPANLIYTVQADNVPVGGTISNTAFTITMPNRNYTLWVDADHIS